jgi:hypothetical protein
MAFSHWAELMSWTLADPECKRMTGDYVQFMYV